jgi:hypothetical protein
VGGERPGALLARRTRTMRQCSFDARSKGQAIQLPLGPLLRFEIDGGSLAASMPDKRFRKPRSRPYSGLLELTQANWGQGLRKMRTLGGIGLSGLE